MNDVRATTHRTILDVLLLRSSRQIDRHDDLLAAGITDVAGLVLHSARYPLARFKPSSKPSNTFGSTGLTRWWSKPGSAVRRRSSGWPSRSRRSEPCAYPTLDR